MIGIDIAAAARSVVRALVPRPLAPELVEQIDCESFWMFYLDFEDELVRYEAPKDLELSGEIVCSDEVDEMAT